MSEPERLRSSFRNALGGYSEAWTKDSLKVSSFKQLFDCVYADDSAESLPDVLKLLWPFKFVRRGISSNIKIFFIDKSRIV